MNKAIFLSADASFRRRVMNRLCIDRLGDQVDFAPSIEELGSLGALVPYDLIVVQSGCRPLDGLEIIDTVEKLMPGKTFVLIRDGSIADRRITEFEHPIASILWNDDGASKITRTLAWMLSTNGDPQRLAPTGAIERRAV